jgi:hypothetical protein
VDVDSGSGFEDVFSGMLSCSEASDARTDCCVLLFLLDD